MTRTLCLTEEHLRRFAEASGDRNPLHTDEAFARRTPYGRCISHGALVAVAALGSVDPQALRHLEELNVQFKQPVFPGERYTISGAQADGEKTRIEVARAGRLATAITVTVDRSRPELPPPPECDLRLPRAPPRQHSIEQLSATDVSIIERYACRLEQLSALARDLGAGGVPPGLLSWLAAASYSVGMLVPGRDAVFVGARILRSSADASCTLTATVTTADDRTGLVALEAELAQGHASARMRLQAFLRAATPTPSRSSIARHLPPSTELADRQILVVGASRGLGAALCGAFATQEATVWAAFARSGEQADRLRREFGAARIRPLQFDAADITQTARALDTVRAEAGMLDGAVLCAAPPLYESSLHPEASEETLRFVASSLAMSLVPLAEVLQLLAPEGWLVLTSSSALDDVPEPWPHYVIAKAALEGAAAYCARQTHARVIVVRPPKMWTDSTNTPLGRIGAVATEQVAAAIVRWVRGGDTAGDALLLNPQQLQGAPGPLPGPGSAR